MSLQATGLISGFDVNSIIDDLIKAESAPRRRLEERERILTAQQDQLKTINSNLMLLQSRAASLADRTSTLQKIATSSDTSILNATASTSAPRQTHQIEVSQLATASRNTSTTNISKPLELNRLAKLTLEGTGSTGSFYLDNYSSTRTIDLTTTTDLADIVSTNGATFVPSEDTYQNLSYKATYHGEGADARLSVTKRVSKRDTDANGAAVLTDQTKSLVANPITFTDTDTNTTSTLGLSTNPQTIFGTGDAYDDNAKPLSLDASNQTHLLGAIRVVESQNSGTSLVNESGNVSASATSFAVDSGSQFTVSDTIVIDNEQMTVTGISTNTLTVVRGVNGTTPDIHNDNARVYGDIVRVSTDSIGSIAKGDVLTFTGGDIGTATVTGVVKGIVNFEAGTFAIYGGTDSYDLTGATVTANASAVTTLSSAISSTGATSVAVTSASGLAAGDTITIGSEQMAITAISGNTLTVTRNANSTTAATHSNAATVNTGIVTTLASAISSTSTTSIAVKSTSGITVGDTILVGGEEMSVSFVRDTALIDTTPTGGNLSAAWSPGQTHTTNISQTSTDGSGSGATFSITTDSSGNPTVTVTENGTGYVKNEVLTLTDPGILPTDNTPSGGNLSAAWTINQSATTTSQTGAGSGGGTGATFSITTDGSGNPTVTVTDSGTGHAVGNTITITDPGTGLLSVVDTTPTPSTAWQINQSSTTISQTGTNGSGSGATFSITTNGSGNPTVTITAQGSGYAVGEVITITDPGSTTNTATVTVAAKPTATITVVTKPTATVTVDDYTLTVDRGANSTTTATHSNGATVTTATANDFTASALTPGSFTVNNSTYYVPKALDSSLAVKQSNTNNIATTQTLAEVSSSITAGTITINGTSVTVATSNTIAAVISNITSSVSGITASLTNGGRIQIKANAGVPISVQDGTSNLATQLNFSQGIVSGKSLDEFDVTAGTFTISDTATSTSATIVIGSSTSVATTLSSEIADTSTTSVSVSSASGLSTGDTIIVGSEQMTISGISGTTLTVSRGANSTTAATHTTGSSVRNISVTETLLDVLRQINQAGFGITASLQPSGDIRLVNADGTKTGLSVSDGTSNFATVFGFVDSGVTLQDVFDSVNATSTATIGVQEVVKGTGLVYLGESLSVSDNHALWVNGQAFVMSTSADNGYTTVGELIDAINQNSDSTEVKASLTRLKSSGDGLNSSTSSSAVGYFQLTSQDGNGINTFFADTADVSSFTQTASSNDTVTFTDNTSVTALGQKVTFAGGALGAEQVELEVQTYSSATSFTVRTDKDLTNAVLVKVTDADGANLFPPTELTTADLTNLSANITASATSITVADSANLAVHDVISIDEEQMRVTAIGTSPSPDTLTVTRGYNDSIAATHSSNASIGLAFGYDRIDTKLGTLDKKRSKKQIFVEQEENRSLTLGGSSDTSDFINAVGLNDLLVVAESHKLGFDSNDTSLYNPKAEVRSSIDGLATSINLNQISSEIEAGTFKIDGNSVAVGTPSSTTLSTLIGNIIDTKQNSSSRLTTIGAAISSTTATSITISNAATYVNVNDIIAVESELMLVTAIPSTNAVTVTRGYNNSTAATHVNGSDVSGLAAFLADGQLQITTTGDTLLISDDLATSPGDDPDTSTKLLKVLGIPTGTYTQGDFAGLTTNATLGQASINSEQLDVTLSTTVNDLIAKINSTDFSNLEAKYNSTDDTFRLQSELSTASRISLGATGDTSNILMALKLSETTQRSEIAGTQAKLVSFTDPLTSSIQNGDTFYLNNEQVTILDLNTTGIDVDDIVSAVNELTSATSVTAYDRDPDSSASSADGNLYLKRTDGTRIELQSGSLDVYSELRVKNSDLQVQDSSNNVISTTRSVIESSGRLGGVDIYSKLSEGRFRSGSVPTAGTFNINSVTITYEDDDSLQDILDRINSSDAGVTASYNVLEDKINMVSNSTGSPLIRLESNQVNQLTFTNADVDSADDQIFFHRSKDTSIQDSENEKDWVFIADGTDLSLYDATSNTVASNTTGETITLSEATLQSTIKGVAVKDALLPNTQSFRSTDNFTMDVDPVNKYAVKQYSSAYNAFHSSTASSNLTITANSDVFVGNYTVTHAESGRSIFLTRDRDSLASTTDTYTSSGSQTVTVSFTNGGTVTLVFDAATLDSAGADVLNNTKIRVETVTKDNAAVDSGGNIYAIDQVYDSADTPDVTYSTNETIGESSKNHLDDGTLRTPTKTTFLGAAITTTPSAGTSQTITVKSSSGFSVGDTITIDSEQMTITAVPGGGTTLTITRGANTTSRTTHADEAIVSSSSNDLDLSSSTIAMDLTALPSANTSTGTFTYSAPTNSTRANMKFTLTGDSTDFAGYKQYNPVTIMDSTGSRRFEGVVETSGSLATATSIEVRPVANFEDAPSNDRTLPYLDNVYFDGAATMMPGRRAADGSFGAYNEQVFLDLTRATGSGDYDFGNSGAQNGIQISNAASSIGAVLELKTSSNNSVSALGGGSGNLILQSTSGFDADITVSSANWSASGDTITVAQGANYNWGAGNVSVKGLSGLSLSGTVTSETGTASNDDNLSGGTGYGMDASGASTSGGSGSGLTVNTTTSGGAVTGVTINNAGDGYADNDTITISGSGNGDATFQINGITATAANVAFSNGYFRNISNDTLTATVNGSANKTLTKGASSNGFTVTNSQNISLVGVTGGISTVVLNEVAYAGTGSHGSAGIGLDTSGTDSYLKVTLNDTSSGGDVLQFKTSDILTIKNQTAFGASTNGQAKIIAQSGTNDATLHLVAFGGSGFANVDFPDSNSTHITGLKRTSTSDVNSITPNGTNLYTINLTDADHKYKDGDMILFRQQLDAANNSTTSLEERLLEVTATATDKITVRMANDGNTGMTTQDAEPDVGLRSLIGDTTANGKILAPEQGIAISGTKMFVADGTHQLRVYTIDPTNAATAPSADSTLTVDLGTARFKNLFGVYDDGTNYNVYGLGKTAWYMGDLSTSSAADKVDRNVLVAQIRKSDGSLTATVTTPADAVDLTSVSLDRSGDEVRRITDGQVVTLSSAASSPDGSRLTEAGRAYLFLSYEVDSAGTSEKAVMKAYRLDTGTNATDPDSNAAIDFVFADQKGDAIESTIDSFAIEELAGGEVIAAINYSGDTQSYDLTQTSSDGSTASDTAAVTDNRPAIFPGSGTNTISYRDNELDEDNSDYDGYARIFSGNGSIFIAGTTASTAASSTSKTTTTYREQKGAGFMDVAFVADSQTSLIKVLDISRKAADPIPQKNIKITYGGNAVGTVQDLSVDHPHDYYSDTSSNYQDNAYLYAISDDGTNGGLFRLDATDPLASGIGTVTATSGRNFRLLAADGLNKDSGTAETLTHVFASQGNVFVSGQTGGSGNSKVAFFTNQSQLNGVITATDDTGIVVDDGSVFKASDVIIVDDEQMTVSSISSNTLTVVRGANSTTATAHDDDAPVLIASALTANHLTYAKVDTTETSSKYELAGTITDLFFDDSAHSNLSSGRYLYVGVDDANVYRYDMETTLGEVVEYELSGLGISAVKNIAVSHPSSTQTILYVTDSADDEKVSAFDISSGTPTPLSITTVNSADEVFIGRDATASENQVVHFVDDATMYTMSDLSATNAFMSALNLSEDSGTAGKDLVGRLNGFEFQRNQNGTSDLLTGVTLNFKGTTGIGSPISVMVEPDTDSVVDSVKTFVDQYNETETALRQAVNARRIFNPKTEEELIQGVLANDTMLRSLMMRLSSISSLPVVGTGSVKRLADLGINRGRAGSVSIDQVKSGLELKLDESRLRSAITSNPEGAASIFGSISTLSTKAHRPIPKETETTVTVSSANYSLLETKIGRQILIENSTSGTVVPMTLTSVSASGNQLTLVGGTFSTADYSGYDLELVTDNTNPWYAIKINSTTVNATNNETVLKINDGGTLNSLKDLQNLNRVANKLNSTADVQVKTSMGSNLSNSETSSITLSDASKFADSGTIVVSEIDSSALQYEVITYTGKSGNTLTGLTRGVDISSSVTTSAQAFATSNSAKVSQTLFTVNVTDVDADDNFVTVGGYLDTDLVNTTNSKIVSVDGTVADITMTAIEQSATNQSILKVDPSLAKEFSGGTRLRLKQGSQTNNLNVLSLDIDPISGFSSKTMPPQGDDSGNVTKDTNASGQITAGGTTTTKMTVWADDLRSFIGRSQLLVSNGTTDEIAEINSIDTTTRLLSGYTNATLFVTGGSASQSGITAASSLFDSGLSLGNNSSSDKGKFEVHVGDIVYDVDLFNSSYSTGSTITLANLATRIDNVSGVSAEVNDTNYIYVTPDTSVSGVESDTPIVITGKSNGINLFSATNRDEDLIKFKGIAEVTLDTPANVPNLTGFNTIKAAYNDTMIVQGMLPTLTTGDLLVEGVAESTENTMAAYTKLSTGIIGNRLRNIQRQTRRVNEDMETFDDKLVVKETKLLREFGALEAALGQTQIQSQYLTLQLASLQSTAQSMASKRKR